MWSPRRLYRPHPRKPWTSCVRSQRVRSLNHDQDAEPLTRRSITRWRTNRIRLTRHFERYRLVSSPEKLSLSTEYNSTDMHSGNIPFDDKVDSTVLPVHLADSLRGVEARAIEIEGITLLLPGACSGGSAIGMFSGPSPTETLPLTSVLDRFTIA